MQRSQFRHFERLRVRWAEVDMQRIVFNGHYLMYLDTAVASYWRALALPYHETMEGFQGDTYVRKATLEYLASARFEDRLDVGIRCERIGNSSMLFQGGVFRDDSLLVSGELVYVFADPATQSSKPVPQVLRDWLQGYEAGEPMTTVRLGDWAELGAAAAALRHAVFVQEQGISAALEADSADATAVHALARNRLGLPVGTGRLLFDAQGSAKIGRMAVRQDLRSSGVGAALLRALVQRAREQGAREVVLHAQTSAVDFYLRAGFAKRGEVFEEAGKPHQTMALAC